MIRIEYFRKQLAERNATLAASDQKDLRSTDRGQLNSFNEEEFNHLLEAFAETEIEAGLGVGGDAVRVKP